MKPKLDRAFEGKIWRYKINDKWYKKLWIKLKFRLFAKKNDLLITTLFEYTPAKDWIK